MESYYFPRQAATLVTERRVREIKLLESAEVLKEQMQLTLESYSLRENTTAKGVFESKSVGLHS